jgi:membrane-bound serine protease (ClpP class)
MIWFPRSRYGRDVGHKKSLAGAYAGDSNLTVGQIGQAESDLRPAGIARFGEQRESVVTEGDYVTAGSLVSVIEVRGSQVVVEFAQKTTKGVPHKEPQGGS